MYFSGDLGSLPDKSDDDYSSFVYLKLIKMRSRTPRSSRRLGDGVQPQLVWSVQIRGKLSGRV